MKLVIFGLTVSSSWGNGHATLWRGWLRGLLARGHRVVFFERDVPYYAENRDLRSLDELGAGPGGTLRFYTAWDAETRALATRELADADAGMVTSYCPDGPAAADLLLGSAAKRTVFYDMDTPVTLERLRAGEPVPYLLAGGLGDFDLVLSFTGGPALTELQARLGARRVAPLYGSVDPGVHRPVPASAYYRADLSYLGTYAPDRQAALEAAFIEPARQRPDRRFVLAGAQYPPEFPWTPNVWFVRHLPPGEHPAFFCSSRLTLNVTRGAMATMGWCPSGRLFEAAACGCPLLSDWWPGLDEFFTPGRELLLARTTAEALAALDATDGELRAVAKAARERVLSEHTAERRALEMETLLCGE